MGCCLGNGTQVADEFYFSAFLFSFLFDWWVGVSDMALSSSMLFAVFVPLTDGLIHTFVYTSHSVCLIYFEFCD